MLNILLYKNTLRVGGAEKQFLLMANHLTRQRFRIFTAAAYADESMVERLSADVPFLEFPACGYWRSAGYLGKLIDRYSVDICHTWDFKSSVAAFWATRWKAAKMIDGSIRSAPSAEMFKRRSPLRLQRGKVRLFSRLGIPVLANSRAGLRSYGIRNYSRAQVIYNGYVARMNSERRPLLLSGEIKVAMVANMRWKKDFLTFIKGGLLVLKERPGVHFYLIGDGPDRDHYEKFLAGDPRREAFHFTGLVADAVEYVDQMDIGVLCNEGSGEGLSNSIMEYMGCGKPVIATDLGGNGELVADGETGFLIREQDAEGLAVKLLYLIKYPEQRLEMGARGRKRVQDQCSLDIILPQVEDYYSSLVN